MIGSGLFKATVHALKEVGRLDQPADLKMRVFFKRNEQLGKRDRAVVSQAVFDVFRHRRLYAHWCASLGGLPERGLAFCSLFRQGLMPEGLEAYIKPWELSERDQAWFKTLFAGANLLDDMRPAVRLSLPDWMFEKLVADFGEDTALKMGEALMHPAPLDLRVNTLKGETQSVLAQLVAAGFEGQPVSWMPNAIRVQGKPALEKTDLFLNGMLEAQDAGSQWLAAMVDAKRGQTIVDFCAGAGGKTLAMAAAMRNTGQIYAVDVNPARLTRMRPRLARAGVTNVQPMGIDSEMDPKLRRLNKKCDRVLVDAPCSGSGTLRRNPDIKWRSSPEQVHQLTQQQFSILSSASHLVRPGGRLIYATCSVFVAENEQVIERFLAEPTNGRFRLLEQGLKHPITGNLAGQMRLMPHEVDADGFFVCVLERTLD